MSSLSSHGLIWWNPQVNVEYNHNLQVMPMALSFNHDGLLPPGDHPLTLSELKTSVLVQGPEPQPEAGWYAAWRLALVERAEILIKQPWEIGIEKIYLNGSFTEAKAHPNDIDGYFVCEVFDFASGAIQRKLNALDPHKIWTWDPAERRAYRDYMKKQLPMWHVYRIELYPHFGQSSGIKDSHGHHLLFPSAFRLQRGTDAAKGIVQVVHERRSS